MLVAGAVTVVATTVAFAATGDLTQPAGTAGCISETGADTCADGHSLDGVWAVDVSPDGKNVYAATNVSNSVAILQRNMTNGSLT